MHVHKVAMEDVGGVLVLFERALPFCEPETFNHMRQSLYALCGRGDPSVVRSTDLEYVLVAKSAGRICATLFLTQSGCATLLAQEGVRVNELNRKIRSALRKDHTLVHKFTRILCEAT